VSTRGRLIQTVVLLRLHNCLIAAASVLVGAFLARSSLAPRALLGAAAAFLVAAGGYALNDLYDIETDRVNKGWRPLPSGRIGRRYAMSLAALLWVAGIVLSASAGAAALGFAIAWTVLVWLYCSRLKSAGLAGHLIVSAVASSGFMMGAAIGGRSAAGLLPFGLAFLFHFAREVVKGTADIRGDVAAGIRTLPAGLGQRASAVLCTASLAAVMALSVLPWAAGVYGVYYMLPVLVIEPLLALCIYMIVSSTADDRANARAHGRVAKILKAVMPVGMLAFLLGGIQ